MGKGKFRLVALVVAAFALVASACFQIRVIALIGDKALSEGATTQYKIDLYRISTTNDSTSYVVMMVGLQDLDFVSFSSFDLKGNFGGPLAITAHSALLTYMRADDHCSANGISATDVDAASFEEWALRRTTVEVDSSSGGFSQRFRIKLNVKRELGNDDDARGSIVVFSAAWDDFVGPMDGIVDDGEVECTSVYMASIPFKP